MGSFLFLPSTAHFCRFVLRLKNGCTLLLLLLLLLLSSPFLWPFQLFRPLLLLWWMRQTQTRRLQKSWIEGAVRRKCGWFFRFASFFFSLSSPSRRLLAVRQTYSPDRRRDRHTHWYSRKTQHYRHTRTSDNSCYFPKMIEQRITLFFVNFTHNIHSSGWWCFLFERHKNVFMMRWFLGIFFGAQLFVVYFCVRIAPKNVTDCLVIISPKSSLFWSLSWIIRSTVRWFLRNKLCTVFCLLFCTALIGEP